jgi:hypothetical protein
MLTSAGVNTSSRVNDERVACPLLVYQSSYSITSPLTIVIGLLVNGVLRVRFLWRFVMMSDPRALGRIVRFVDHDTDG